MLIFPKGLFARALMIYFMIRKGDFETGARYVQSFSRAQSKEK